MEAEGYMPLPQAAKFLGVSTETLRHWCKEHNIDHMRVPAGRTQRERYLISIPALRQFIEKHRHPAQTEPRRVGRPSKLKAL